MDVFRHVPLPIEDRSFRSRYRLETFLPPNNEPRRARPAHGVLAHRAAEQGRQRTAHAAWRSAPLGGQRAPLISQQRLSVPLRRLVRVLV